jgi:hypothetical protein
MPRDPRWVQEGGGLDEVTCVVIQNRYLLRPSVAEEAARAREREGRRSLGVAKILRARPYRRPKKVEGSPKPRFHAVTEAAFRRMREAYGEVIAAFREASARLLDGDRSAEFPEGTFPPGLPFVPFPSTALARARGQPA